MGARAAKRTLLAVLAMACLIPLPAGAQSICIDPGHGGTDPGAVGCGLEEDAINLDTGLRLRTLLEGAGFGVVMTRDADENVALASRSAYANSQGVDRFVSIHSNSAGTVASGIETFCSTAASSQSVDLRDKIQEEMVATWPLPNRGGKTANFSVLVNTAMPATLTELGFINNCSVDATYLADPNERQRAAEAHLRAIQRHFGQDPGSGGWAQGAVFADQGVGTDDMSIRLPGAVVTVVETGASASAEEPDALWAFQLEPGGYTIRASLEGYRTAERSCDVTANATAWCSIGLFPDEPEPEPDAGEADGQDDANDGGADTEADGGDDELVDGGDEEDPPDTKGGGCDCGREPGVGGGLWIGLAVLVLGLTGRKRVALLLCALLAGTASLAGAGDGHGPALPARVAPFATLQDVSPRPGIDCAAPVVSPDGQGIACSDASRSKLSLVDPDGQSTLLVTKRGAGVLPVWTPDGQAIGLRTAGRPFSGQVLELHDLTGRLRGPYRPGGRLFATQRDDRIYLSAEGEDRLVSLGRDRFYAPILSPDGRYLVYNGLVTGLYLHRLEDGLTVHLGSGNHPAFSADGRLLVFDRTLDDGHQLTAGDLWLTDLTQPDFPTAPLTDTPDAIETWPSLSANGTRLAYLVDGVLHLAKLSFRP